MRILILLLALTGCAAIEDGRRVATLDDIDTGGRNGVCVRQCLDSHSSCAGRAASADGDVNNRRILGACKSNYSACVKTC